MVEKLRGVPPDNKTVYYFSAVEIIELLGAVEAFGDLNDIEAVLATAFLKGSLGRISIRPETEGDYEAMITKAGLTIRQSAEGSTDLPPIRSL